MNSEAARTPDRLASAYLEQLGELAVEIDAAIHAMAANSIGLLEESVSKQEMLCASLAKMANVVGSEPWSGEPRLNLSGVSGQDLRSHATSGPDAQPDENVEEKIRSAKAVIFNLTLRYAALLKHSGESITLLASLCRSHTGQFQETRGGRSKHQTWSCEM